MLNSAQQAELAALLSHHKHRTSPTATTETTQYRVNIDRNEQQSRHGRRSPTQAYGASRVSAVIYRQTQAPSHASFLVFAHHGQGPPNTLDRHVRHAIGSQPTAFTPHLAPRRACATRRYGGAVDLHLSVTAP